VNSWGEDSIKSLGLNVPTLGTVEDFGKPNLNVSMSTPHDAKRVLVVLASFLSIVKSRNIGI
jgi:hypothetical protein